MWEKERVDGKKKLKVHAIPTIFGHAIMQMQNNRASSMLINEIFDLLGYCNKRLL